MLILSFLTTVQLIFKNEKKRIRTRNAWFLRLETPAP